MLSFNRLWAIVYITILALLAPAAGFAAKNAKPTKNAKPAAPQSTVYKVRLNSSFGDAGTRKLTLQGNKFLWEVATAGMDLKLIKNDDGLFMIGRTPYIGKYPPGSKNESPMALFPGPIGNVKEFLKANSAKSLGKATLNKKSCDVYEYKEKVSGWKCKLWLDPKTSEPVQLELSGPNKADNATATYLSYKLNEKIPATTFDLPKDKKIRPMPEPKAGKATDKKAPKKEEKPK
jgi:outer membrane lipoprotein-sorting protein